MRTSTNEEESSSMRFGRERTAESSPTRGTRWGAVAAAVAATAAGATPAFTVGALTGPITATLGISNWTFGLALACFFAATAAGSPFAARPVERLGPAVAMGVAALAAGALMVLLAQPRSVVALGAMLAAAGLTNALVAPATGRVLGAEVAPERLSLSAGMVQASLFVAPLVAGLFWWHWLPSHTAGAWRSS